MKKSDTELSKLIDYASSSVIVGGVYSHYKNSDNKYKILHLAIIESNAEVCVVYKPQYGAKIPFVRPLSNWLEEKVIDGRKVKRFTLINGV